MKKRSRKHWILYDARALGNQGTAIACVLVSCDSNREAMSYAGDYGEMACYTYEEDTEEEHWLWDWLPESGFYGRWGFSA